tara:strand:- start:15156 stop:15581 length:426 start_codon:yes stop_codon:yes gene_type:complete
MPKFGRDDIKDFIRNFQEAAFDTPDKNNNEQPRLLNECGCEDSDYGLGDKLDPYDHSTGDLAALYAPKQMELSQAAQCPDSYNKTAHAVLQDPNIIIDLLIPALQDLNIGCPASMAKAVADILDLSQTHGITPVFNTEDLY